MTTTAASQVLARLEQKVNDVVERLCRIEKMIQTLSSAEREHSQTLARHDMHLQTIDKRVEEINQRANWIGSLNAALAAVLAAIAAIIKR